MEKLLSKKSPYTFEDLRQVVDILRSETGCPWDKEQTNESLKSSTLEEVYEVLEAINNEDYPNLQEELGDLLLHVVFHSKIAQDENKFDLEGVIHEIVVKLIRRHPHVFKEATAGTADEVLLQWDAIKKDEKQLSSHSESLEQVPKAMPALMRAYKVQKKAAKVGFDFPQVQMAYEKVYEEMKEFQAATLSDSQDAIEEEYGDLLFSVVNISRFFGVNPEISLTNATEKFINRFKGIEKLAQNKGFDIEKLSILELDILWNEVKNGGK
ncbi:MAG: nucleoside triphosphate pyrophosphohydrolase [Vallitaleaceae bacterium]|nr:nucleoside triphosphate pyrophosphohydrolase [Vallitaleaceae bacterium]